jgi:glycolate oxidase iron-sulfur subunit
LIEPFRVAMESSAEDRRKTDDWFHRWVLFWMFPNRQLLEKLLAPARLAQLIRADRLLVDTGLWKWLPSRVGRLATLLPRLKKQPSPLPGQLPAKGQRRARVALFTGCVADAMFRETNWATARVLQENGCDVIVPANQACCGAIHFHAGSSEPARELADRNATAFRTEDVDAVIVNVAGCGSMLKEYGHHWPTEGADEARRCREEFAAKTKDITEFLDELGIVDPPGELRLKATYHDACHLAHAQQIRAAPRRLLAKIPGLELVELPESELCCGAAGTYNLTEPEMAERLGRRKLDNIRATAARVVVTANAGCLLQIARQARMDGERLAVAHPVDLLDLSYRRLPFSF